jgi:hypothetical protein
MMEILSLKKKRERQKENKQGCFFKSHRGSCMVAYTYNLSYSGGIGRRIMIQDQPWEIRARPHLKNS